MPASAKPETPEQEIARLRKSHKAALQACDDYLAQLKRKERWLQAYRRCYIIKNAMETCQLLGHKHIYCPEVLKASAKVVDDTVSGMLEKGML